MIFFSIIETVFLVTDDLNYQLFISQFTDKDITSVPSNWEFYNTYSGNKITSCNDYDLVGGYNIIGSGSYITGQFSGFPEHIKLRVNFLSAAVDSWDSEKAIYDIDSHISYSVVEMLWGQQSFCGSSIYLDNVLPISIAIDHNTNILNIKFSNSLDTAANDESWGFRDFSIEYLTNQCAKFYTECNYQGTLYEFCQDSPNENRLFYPNTIQSIIVPGAGYIRLVSTNSEEIIIRKNIPCMATFEFHRGDFE